MTSWRDRPRTLSQSSGDPVVEAYYDGDLERLAGQLAANPDYLSGASPVLHGAPICVVASREDRQDVLQLLYRLSGDSLKHLGHRDATGKTCLHAAIRAKALSATSYLLGIGADPNEPDGDLLRPLHAACVVEQTQLVEALLAAGADCNLPDQAGNLPLHQACQEDQEAVARLLVDATTDIDALGASGRTALHYAALAQSLPLMQLLMERGASVRKYDEDRHTPMDIVLRMGNQNTLAGLADYFASMVTEKCDNIDQLIGSQNFRKVLNILETIDDDLENPVDSPVLLVRRPAHLSPEERQRIVQRIASNDRIDFIEFRRLVPLIAANSLSPELIEAGCVENLTQLVCKLVLFREDVELLTTIMFGTTLWPKIQKHLEDRIEALYDNCAEIGSTGMVALMHRSFFDKERHIWRADLMLKFFHTRLKLPVLEPNKDGSRKFLRDPVRSLSVWSVMSGRFHLTEELLKSEQFDVLPIGLFCVALLRKLTALSGIPRPTKKTMELVADRVESICMMLVRAVNTIDTSEKKMVAINFIRQRLPVYGELTCMGLASHGLCDSFMVMQAVQGGVDREWLKRLYHSGTLYRELLVLLGLVPFNPLLFVLLRRLWIATCHLEGSFPGETGRLDRVEVVAIHKGGDDDVDDPEDDSDGEAESTAKDPNAEVQGKKVEVDASDELWTETILHEAGRPSSGNAVRDALGLYVRTMFGFYFTPSVKFHYHIMAHLIFIGTFSYIAVASFEYHISNAEIVVYLFLLGFLLEELHELNEARLKGSMLGYITDGWNALDTLGLTLSFIGFCMRMPMVRYEAKESITYVFTDMYYWWTRFVLQMACLVYWMRLLYVSTVMETLGPKLKMISVMITRDFVPFLIMLAIMMFGFGIVIYAMLFPNGYHLGNPTQTPGAEIFQSMFKITFYAMVGEYSMDTITGKECSEGSKCPHPLGQILVPNVIMCIYIIIVSVLLLNLIVASFSKTVDEIDKKSVAMWQFERYDLLEEFMMRSPLPPPLSILGEVARWIVTAWEVVRHTEVLLRRRTFSKHRIIYFLTLQAFCMRGQRAKLVGEVEVEDPERLIPQMARKVKRLRARLSTVRARLSFER